MPIQDPRLLPDDEPQDPRLLPDDAPKPMSFWDNIRKGFFEGLPELAEPSINYPGATSNAPITVPGLRPGGPSFQTTVGDISRATMPIAGGLAEVYNKAIRPLTSAPNLMLMGATIAQPELAPVAGAVFGAQMATQIPEQVRSAYKQAQETGAFSPEAIGKYGEVGLTGLFAGGAVGGAAKYKANQVGKIASPVRFSTEPGFGETPAGPRPPYVEPTRQGTLPFPEPQIRTPPPPVEGQFVLPLDYDKPTIPLKPPINQVVAEAVTKPPSAPETMLDVTGKGGLEADLSTIEGIQKAYTEGKLSREDALKNMAKIHRKTLVKPERETPAQKTQSVIEEGEEVIIDPDTGEIISPKPYPLTTEPTADVTLPAGVDEVTNLMVGRQVKNIAELQKKLGVSFQKTKELWEAAKEQGGLLKNAEGYYERPETASTTVIEQGTPTETKGVVKFSTRNKLREEGFTHEDIDAMTPAQAEETLRTLGHMRKSKRQSPEEIEAAAKVFTRTVGQYDTPSTIGVTEPSKSIVKVTREQADKTYMTSLRNEGYVFKGSDEKGNFIFEKPNTPSARDRLFDTESQKMYDAETGMGGMDIPEGGRRDVIEIFRGTISGSTPQVAGKELIQNAIDAASTVTGGRVKVRYNENKRTLEVEDNGPGITLDKIWTDYLDLTGSGKRGGEQKTIGELGVGKIAYLTKGERFNFRTVTREADGQLYEHKFSATPDDVLDLKLKIESNPVPEGTQTGVWTSILTESGEKWFQLDNYLESFKKHSNLSVPVEISKSFPRYSDPTKFFDDNSVVTPQTKIQTGKLVGEGDSPGGHYRVSIPKDVGEYLETNKIEAILVSRGMFQGVQTIYTRRKAKVPDRLIVEIEPTVKGTHPQYPLTTPTRESMKDSTFTKVWDLIDQEIVDGAAKTRELELQKTFHEMVPEPGKKFVIVDPQGKFTPEEIALISNSRELEQAARISRGILEELIAEFSDELSPNKKIYSNGYILDNEVRGMNVRNPHGKEEHAILLNPINILKSARNPAEAAESFLHVTLHEFTHILAWDEGAGFTSAFANVYPRYGARRLYNAAARFEKALTGGTGQYTEQVLELFQRGKEAQRRTGSKTLPLIAEEGSKLPETSGLQGVQSNAGQGGNRTLRDIPIGKSIVINSKQASPQVLKKLWEEGFRFESDTPTGGLKFVKKSEPSAGPLLEEDVLPTEKPPKESTEIGMPRQIYDLSRGLMSVDPPFVTSAAFRQASPWIGTKNWFKSWASAARAFGDKAWYEARMNQIRESPLFKPRTTPEGKPAKSFADTIGLRMTDLKDTKNTRMEGIKAQLAERIPGIGRYVSASNRAFSAFLNDLRFNQLEAFVKDSKVLAQMDNNPMLDLTKNIPLAKEFAAFLNDTTGAAPLRTGIGSHQYSLEMHAQKVADIFFSPRLMASRVRMLNPSTYIMANPAVRKLYLQGMLRMVAAWWGIAQLGKMAGGQVVTDPNNPDFGKIKIGDTRLDPGAGFQQFLVLGSRTRPAWAKLPIKPTNTGIVPLDLTTGYLGTGGGKYSSSISGRSREFGRGFNPPTRTSNAIDFLANKLHPTAKLIYDIGSANERNPVFLGDRLAQMYLPMMTGDLIELMDKHPELIPLVLPFSAVGGGAQTYTGEPTKPLITPLLGLDKYDVQFGGKQ